MNAAVAGGITALLIALVAFLFFCCGRFWEKQKKTLPNGKLRSYEGGGKWGGDVTLDMKDVLHGKSGKGEKRPTFVISGELQSGPAVFSYNELRAATNGFAKRNTLGRGGFGTVYRGTMEADGSEVAIKVLAANSSQGEREFFAELGLISQLSHSNLVRLRGWCYEEKKPAILVYEYFGGGSLDKHIFDNGKGGTPVLPWSQRCKIILDVAKALNYMHSEWTQQVVHRDVKSSNILLDDELNGYLGDFGLALSTSHDMTHFPTTRPAFTIGYAPPEAIYSTNATPKCDVFSFGVVCLEIASGQRGFDQRRGMSTGDPNKVSLWYYAWNLYHSHSLIGLADPQLDGAYNMEEMLKLLSLGLLCTSPKEVDRPSMRDVVRALQAPAGTVVRLPPICPGARPYEEVTLENAVMPSTSGPASAGSTGTSPRYTPTRSSGGASSAGIFTAFIGR